MKRIAGAVMVLLVSVLVGGCADKYESAAKEQLGYLKEMNAVLAKVTDAASLEKAKPELERIGKKTQALGKRMEKTGRPSKEREAQLKKKYEGEFKAVMGELMKNTMRLAAIGGADVGKIMEGMSPFGGK